MAIPPQGIVGGVRVEDIILLIAVRPAEPGAHSISIKVSVTSRVRGWGMPNLIYYEHEQDSPTSAGVIHAHRFGKHSRVDPDCQRGDILTIRH